MTQPRRQRFEAPQIRMGAGDYRSWVLAGIGLLIAGYTASIAAQLFGPQKGSIVTEAVGFVGYAIAMGIAFLGRVRLAAVTALGFFVLELHAAAFEAGAMLAVSMTVLPIVPVAFGFLLGGRAAMLVGLTSAVTYPLSAALGALVIESGPGVTGADAQLLVVLTAGLFSSAAIVNLGLAALDRALVQARANEEKFAQLVRHAPEGIILLDDDGAVESLNPAGERLLGITERHAVGSPLVDLVAARSGQEESADDLLAHGAQPIERTLRLDDGAIARVELTSVPTSRDDGTRGAQITLLDVTDRRTAQRRITQLGRLIDQAQGEIYVAHAETGRLLLVSRGARKNLGYTSPDGSEPSTIVDVNPLFTPETVRDLAGNPAVELAEGGTSRRAVHRRRDGSAYPVEYQIHASTYDDEPVLVVFALDISQRVAAESEQDRLRSQLQQAQKMEAVGQLAGGIAHDFNNFLMSVGGYAQLLERGIDDEKHLTWIANIRTAEAGAAALTQKLLSFARKEVRQPRVVDLGQIVEELRPILARLVEDRVRLEIDLTDDERGLVVADRSQVEQVVVNLVSNARDASESGGSVRVSLRAEAGPDGNSGGPGFVVLEIEDSGEGMTEATRKRIFDPFFTTKPRGRGTGLGLSTVLSIVTENGGRIEVDTELGRGTRFEVWWPAPVAELKERPEGRERVPSEDPEPRRILVVEDDESVRDLVSLVLGDHGHRVLVAADAEEATELLDRHGEALDLLLTDVVLPGRSGFDLAVLAHETHPDLPVLFMSGYLDDLEPGTTTIDLTRDLVLKPFTTDELLARVEAATRAVVD